MNVSVGRRWEEFIDQLIKIGRYASATEVMREGLLLVEEREARLNALRDMTEASISDGGALSDEDVSRHLDEKHKDLKARGY